MSLIDAEENMLSETTAEQDDGDNLKLVPVAESIRYRKRAQSAEKKIETLNEQLRQAKSQATELAEQLNEVQLEQQLVSKLSAEGPVDLETAVLIAKSKMKADKEADLDSVIEKLRKEKAYLFGSENRPVVNVRKTAPAKDRLQNSRTVIERAAKKATATGNRTDLQEYLKLRRNYL